jgi:hypothetical protein
MPKTWRQGDLARSSADDARRREVARTSLNTATPQDAHPRYLRHTGPGIGPIRSHVRRDDRQALHRWPTVQADVSSGRLVTCAQASAGHRWGIAATTRGQAPLPGACADAAVWCLGHPPPAPPPRARWANTHDPGHALTRLAQQWARAGSDRRTRHVACETR